MMDSSKDDLRLEYGRSPDGSYYWNSAKVDRKTMVTGFLDAIRTHPAPRRVEIYNAVTQRSVYLTPTTVERIRSGALHLGNVLLVSLQ